ncbi:MAG: TetR/AcrR family transcriptional regulator [Lachnospiraceae bacterium]|nr:TetR/AcrR family transcriptional regulator [Lachnospiraceae bacterium]
MATPDKSIDPRLLKAAETEFLKQGFIKAELKNICESAGITTGAIYKRYKGKEDLFCAVVADVANELEDFLAKRSEMDFSAFTDEEIYESWVMTYENMVPLFKLLYKNHNKFKLLIGKAAGTRYENFNHEFVTRTSLAYEQFYKEAKKRGLAQAEVTREEFHVLISSFWTGVCEPFIHDMSLKEIEEHCKIMCRFYRWDKVIMLKERG